MRPSARCCVGYNRFPTVFISFLPPWLFRYHSCCSTGISSRGGWFLGPKSEITEQKILGAIVASKHLIVIVSFFFVISSAHLNYIHIWFIKHVEIAAQMELKVVPCHILFLWLVKMAAYMTLKVVPCSTISEICTAISTNRRNQIWL